MPTLVRDDPRVAVAITGSAARGDASKGSDLDLWCVSPKWRGHHRVHGTFDGQDVTLLCDGRASARAQRSLLRCEVNDLLVLRDPRGDFRAIQALASWRAERTWRTLCRNTSVDLARELFESWRGPPWNRMPPLREAALRLASAWAYRRRGWRTPRWRTLRQVLPPRAARRLARLLSIPEPAEARRALEALGRWRPLPDDVQARVRAAEWAEGVLLARRHLEREVVAPRGARRWSLPPRLQRAVRRLHAEPDGDAVAAARREALALGRELGVFRWFSPRVEQLLIAPGS